jgi:hypothetical protein
MQYQRYPCGSAGGATPALVCDSTLQTTASCYPDQVIFRLASSHLNSQKSWSAFSLFSFLLTFAFFLADTHTVPDGCCHASLLSLQQHHFRQRCADMHAVPVLRAQQHQPTLLTLQPALLSRGRQFHTAAAALHAVSLLRRSWRQHVPAVLAMQQQQRRQSVLSLRFVLPEQHRFAFWESFCLVWSGLVWSGLVWSGLVWSGLVWSGLVWSGLVWSGLVWSGLFWSGLVWSGLVRSSHLCFSLFSLTILRSVPGGGQRHKGLH